MKSFFEMYQILQAKKLFEQDGADAGISMGGGSGGMDMGNAPGGVDLGTNGQAGGVKPQNQIPSDQQDNMNQMNMGDDASQLSEPVGTASKSEQKEKVGEIKGLLEDIMAAVKSGQPIDDETTQKLKQALDQLTEIHDSMEGDEEEETEGEETEGGEEQPEEGSESTGEDMSGMDMSGMGGGAPQGDGAPAPQGGQPAGGGNTQMPSMNFGM